MHKERLVIIAGTLNEENSLPEFLARHAWVDEVIILDSGSTDRTLDICREAKCRVFHKDFGGNSNDRLRFALANAASEWVFLIDPDEFITDELRKEVQDVLSNGTAHAGFRNVRLNFFMGRPLLAEGFSCDGLKFFRKSKASVVGQGYHEQVDLDGSIGTLQGKVHHFPHRNIHWMIDKRNYISEFDKDAIWKKYGPLSERQFMWLAVTRPVKTFCKTYFRKKGYKDGVRGFVYSLLTVVYDIILLCKYWEAYLVKSPDTLQRHQIPDPWRRRQV